MRPLTACRARFLRFRNFVPPEAVDAARFRVLVDGAGGETDPAVRSRLFGEALSLWRGLAFAEFPFEEFAQRESSALEELRLAAIEGRIAADLESGGGAELVPELKQLVDAHPLREGLRASQMLALYRAGRQAEALRAYTKNGAFLTFEENLKGSLEPGKLADMVVLSEDPLTIDPLRLMEIEVEATYLHGRRVFQRLP